MSWRKFKRSRSYEDAPFVTITPDRFTYNVHIAKLAQLEKNKYVIYHVNDEERKIGFEFLNNKTDDSYAIGTKKGKGSRSTAGEIVKTNSWIKKISSIRDVEYRRFIAKPEAKLWIITLTPAFENKVKRTEKSKIPSDAKGIYRYIDKDGNIVYIGKGNIKSRLKEIERSSWNFDTIEYSIINNENEQYEWESYWLEKFKEKNNERLPYYNRTSGIKVAPK